MQRPILVTAAVTLAVIGLSAAVVKWPADAQAQGARKAAELSEAARRKVYYFSQDFLQLAPALGLDNDLPEDQVRALLDADQKAHETNPSEARFPSRPKNEGGLGENTDDKLATIKAAHLRLQAWHATNAKALDEAQKLAAEAVQAQANPTTYETQALVGLAQALNAHYTAWLARIQAAKIRSEAAPLIQAMVATAARGTAVENSAPTKAIAALKQDIDTADAKARQFQAQVEAVEKQIQEKTAKVDELTKAREAEQEQLAKLRDGLNARTGADAKAAIDQMATLSQGIIAKDVEIERLRSGSRVTADGKLAPIALVRNEKTRDMDRVVEGMAWDAQRGAILRQNDAGQANEHGLDTLTKFDLPLAQARLDGVKKTIESLSAQLKVLEELAKNAAAEKAEIDKQLDAQVKAFLTALGRISDLDKKAVLAEEKAVNDVLPQVNERLNEALQLVKKRKDQAVAEERGLNTPDKKYPLLNFRGTDQVATTNLHIARGQAEFLTALVLYGRIQALREQVDLINILTANKAVLSALALKGDEKRQIDELTTKTTGELKAEIQKAQKQGIERLQGALSEFQEAQSAQQTGPDDVTHQVRKNTIWSTTSRIGEVYWLMSRFESNPQAVAALRDHARAALGEALNGVENTLMLQPAADLLSLMGGKLQGGPPPMPALSTGGGESAAATPAPEATPAPAADATPAPQATPAADAPAADPAATAAPAADAAAPEAPAPATAPVTP